MVDELHTFDGAQGTDLACLIRRLKGRLEMPPAGRAWSNHTRLRSPATMQAKASKANSPRACATCRPSSVPANTLKPRDAQLHHDQLELAADDLLGRIFSSFCIGK